MFRLNEHAKCDDDISNDRRLSRFHIETTVTIQSLIQRLHAAIELDNEKRLQQRMSDSRRHISHAKKTILLNSRHFRRMS